MLAAQQQVPNTESAAQSCWPCKAPLGQDAAELSQGRTSQTKSVRIVSSTVRKTAPRYPACADPAVPAASAGRLAKARFGCSCKLGAGCKLVHGFQMWPTCHTHAREVVHEQGCHVNDQDDRDTRGGEDHLQAAHAQGEAS